MDDSYKIKLVSGSKTSAEFLHSSPFVAATNIWNDVDACNLFPCLTPLVLFLCAAYSSL